MLFEVSESFDEDTMDAILAFVKSKKPKVSSTFLQTCRFNEFVLGLNGGHIALIYSDAGLWAKALQACHLCTGYRSCC